MEDEWLLGTCVIFMGIIIILAICLAGMSEKIKEKEPPYEKYLENYQYVSGHEYDVKDDGDLRTITVYLEKKDAKR